jgi:antitoxin component YwqK of YwqJK toxin-antitoxin module
MVGAASRLTAAAAIVLLACAPALRAAPDDTLHAEGQCREGLLQGGYTLRSPQGGLRAQGAYNAGQRVGSFIFWNDAGARIAHVPFDADLVNGTVSLWYDAHTQSEGGRRLEAVYRRGERNGSTRAWYADGRPRLTAEYADGTLQSARAWSESGAELAPDASRALAEQERSDDADYLDTLASLVRRHRPDCIGAPPAQLRARNGGSRQLQPIRKGTTDAQRQHA